MAGREGKRGECQTRWGLVWRESGAVRSACLSRAKRRPPGRGGVDQRHAAPRLKFGGETLPEPSERMLMGWTIRTNSARPISRE